MVGLSSRTRGERAQAGIGTLIILIAALLVASIAAGVFFDVAGLLEGQTTSTSEDISQQLDGRLEVVAVSGAVSGDTIDTVNLTVRLGSDAGTVDLRDVTVQWVGPGGAAALTWAGANETGPAFGITTYGTTPVLEATTDRATLTIDPDAFGQPLAAGDVVTLTIITSSEEIYRLRVPDSISGSSAVAL